MGQYLKPIFEQELITSGKYSKIVGIDEAGRGCWAGPVAVGAYIYDLSMPFVEGLNDSKKISEKQRESLFESINDHSYRIFFGEVNQIDNEGISKVIERLIANLVNEIGDANTLFLIDGQFSKDFGDNTRKIIRGDSTYYSIAAASIIAKVSRDRLMRSLAAEFPDYGFEIHKGYGTKKHMIALESNGITKFHRKSYKPILKYINE